MENDRKKLTREYDGDDLVWDQMHGMTVKEAGEYLIKASKTVPENLYITVFNCPLEGTTISAFYSTYESDEEYAARKDYEERIEKDRDQRAKERAEKIARGEVIPMLHEVPFDLSGWDTSNLTDISSVGQKQ